MSIVRRTAMLSIALAAAGLAGCQTPRGGEVAPAPVVAVAPVVEVEPVPMTPVLRPPPPPSSCVPRTLGPAPRYPDSDAALRGAAGAADRYQLLAAGRLMRQQRLRELERVIAGCR